MNKASQGRNCGSLGGWGLGVGDVDEDTGVRRGPRSSAWHYDLGPPKTSTLQRPQVGRGSGHQGAPPGSAQGPSPTCRPVCPQSEEKYRCASDSQCGPQRFPGGGECSPFPTPVKPQSGIRTLEGSTSPWQRAQPRRERQNSTYLRHIYRCLLCARAARLPPEGVPVPGIAVTDRRA